MEKNTYERYNTYVGKTIKNVPKKMDRGTYVNNIQFLHICDILMIYIPLHACAKIKPK
jgi:hypothetical protein